MFGIRKDKLFENTTRRIFYQDKISKHTEDPNAYSANVPGKGGTCSCHVVVLPSVNRLICAHFDAGGATSHFRLTKYILHNEDTDIK